MLNSILKEAVRAAAMADSLQAKDPTLSRIDAVKHAIEIVRKERKA